MGRYEGLCLDGRDHEAMGVEEALFNLLADLTRRERSQLRLNVNFSHGNGFNVSSLYRRRLKVSLSPGAIVISTTNAHSIWILNTDGTYRVTGMSSIPDSDERAFLRRSKGDVVVIFTFKSGNTLTIRSEKRIAQGEMRSACPLLKDWCGGDFQPLDGLTETMASLMRILVARRFCMSTISIGHEQASVSLECFAGASTVIRANRTDIGIVGYHATFSSVIPKGSLYRITGNPGISETDVSRAGTIKIEFIGPSGTKLTFGSENRF